MVLIILHVFVHGISIYPNMMFVTFILFAVNKFGDIQFNRSFNILFVIGQSKNKGSYVSID